MIRTFGSESVIREVLLEVISDCLQSCADVLIDAVPPFGGTTERFGLTRPNYALRHGKRKKNFAKGFHLLFLLPCKGNKNQGWDEEMRLWLATFSLKGKHETKDEMAPLACGLPCFSPSHFSTASHYI
jgi:hypothetical protein